MEATYLVAEQVADEVELDPVTILLIMEIIIEILPMLIKVCDIDSRALKRLAESCVNPKGPIDRLRARFLKIKIRKYLREYENVDKILCEVILDTDSVILDNMIGEHS